MEQEIFILWSTDVPLTTQFYCSEGAAQRAAEEIARNCRGCTVSIAKIVAAVIEPLPDLKWTDGRAAGDGKSRGSEVMGLSSAPQYANCEKGPRRP